MEWVHIARSGCIIGTMPGKQLVDIIMTSLVMLHYIQRVYVRNGKAF